MVPSVQKLWDVWKDMTLDLSSRGQMQKDLGHGGAQAAKVEIISLNGLKALIPGMPEAMVQFIGEMLKEDRSKWENALQKRHSR